ncbi:rCG34361 [Rattus norvegicus]|uniref:RCG34361 n=1 Tax=Rattus norvegicus TaxID=10116 RepID=A6HKC9_RAT|nr:rCG34361 [Rattus norvegicus]
MNKKQVNFYLIRIADTKIIHLRINSFTLCNMLFQGER